MIVTAFDARHAKQMRPGDFFAFKEKPGLRLVATQTKRTWTYRYAAPGTGKQTQLRLGHWPALGFADAVAAWEEARGQRSRGVDVGAEARGEKRDKKVQAEAIARREEQTCSRVVEQYLSELVSGRKTKGQAEVRRMLERAIAPVATLPAAELTAPQAHQLILDVAITAKRVAAMTRQELRAAWAHALTVGRVAGVNPFAGKTIGGTFKATARSRALSVTEVGALLRWMAEPKAYSRTVADALELVLRTGLRSGEVCGIHSREIAERAGVLWLDIPGHRMKEQKAHGVPLVGRAAGIVRARMTEGVGFLFPRARDGERSIEQKVLGVEVYACSGRSKATAYKRRRVCPVKDWTPHDLRRTARTLLAELGCPFEVGEAILAHALPGVAGVYNRAKHEAAKVEWLTRLNEHLDALQLANVVVLHPRTAA